MILPMIHSAFEGKLNWFYFVLWTTADEIISEFGSILINIHDLNLVYVVFTWIFSLRSQRVTWIEKFTSLKLFRASANQKKSIQTKIVSFYGYRLPIQKLNLFGWVV